jgi:branched-chain amino acid transport system substrate-binding protein
MGRRLLPLAAAALVAAWGPAAAQVTSSEVTFGMAGPFSGPAKETGKSVRTGIEVAFAAQNAQGGVHGRRLALVAVDDGLEPSRTAAAMRELVETRRVFGVVGNVGTATAEVAVPYANERGVVFFGAVSGAKLMRHAPPDRFVFNYRASYAEETAAIVRHLVEVRRIAPERIAVLSQDDAFGEAGFEGVSRILRQYRRDPAKVLRVRYRRNTADVEDAVRSVVQHAKELGAVVMIATYKPAARFIERVRDAGVSNLVFTNVSDVDSSALGDELAQLGPGYAGGVIVTQVVPPPTASATTILRYQAELKAHAPGEKPNHLSLEGWISARLLIEGLQRAGKALTTDALIDALEGIRSLDVGLGAPLGFGPSEHQASHAVWGTVLDGKGAAKPLDLM